jgi:hypothetical protein
VTVRFLNGKAPAVPIGWAREGDGLTCLACRRAAVAQRAVEDAKRAGRPQRRARTEALIRFEIDRDPGASNKAIAKRLPGVSFMAVAKLRPAPGPTPGEGRWPDSAMTAERLLVALRDCPDLFDREVAAIVGCSKRTVNRHRNQLEAEGLIPPRKPRKGYKRR